MSKITFRGRTYNSEFEMPEDVRQAYQEFVRSNETNTKSLADIVDMPEEVKAIYERALGRVDQESTSSKPLSDLPRTEDLYRRSAPADMKDLPSDESVYRPSEPVIDPIESTVEPDTGAGRLISSVIWLLILAAIAYLVLQFLS